MDTLENNNTEATALVQTALGESAAKLFGMLLGQKPIRSDVIVFLQGDRLDRAETVAQLYREGFAPLVLITGNNDLIGRGKRNEENDMHLDELKNYLVEHGVLERAILIDATSMNTPDQAVHTLALAREHGWKKLLVVTSPFHVLRAYLTFAKKAQGASWGGAILMHAANLPWDIPPSGRERSALEMLLVELEKIKKYEKDVATVEAGLIHLT